MRNSETTLDETRYTDNLDFIPENNQRLASLCGFCDENLRQVETALKVEIKNRGHQFQITGHFNSVKIASRVLKELYNETEEQPELTPNAVNLVLQEIANETPSKKPKSQVCIKTPMQLIKPHGDHQYFYVERIRHNDINFGIGPAGTGKTYLAVASAVEALDKQLVKRLILVRPAVEAGEKLGFLPGDLVQKVDPYLRPIYDALYETLGIEKVTRLIEKNIIEVAPLAYMRGRTLNDSFVILDEAQNATPEQMKMFLTRIGFGSKTVVTGDITQTDLPKGKISGLSQSINLLKNIEGISFTFFEAKDVVRHPLVQLIVKAYDSQK